MTVNPRAVLEGAALLVVLWIAADVALLGLWIAAVKRAESRGASWAQQ